jgi:hypothetical protein
VEVTWPRGIVVNNTDDALGYMPVGSIGNKALTLRYSATGESIRINSIPIKFMGGVQSAESEVPGTGLTATAFKPESVFSQYRIIHDGEVVGEGTFTGAKIVCSVTGRELNACKPKLDYVFNFILSTPVVIPADDSTELTVEFDVKPALTLTTIQNVFVADYYGRIDWSKATQPHFPNLRKNMLVGVETGTDYYGLAGTCNDYSISGGTYLGGSTATLHCNSNTHSRFRLIGSVANKIADINASLSSAINTFLSGKTLADFATAQSLTANLTVNNYLPTTNYGAFTLGLSSSPFVPELTVMPDVGITAVNLNDPAISSLLSSIPSGKMPLINYAYVAVVTLNGASVMKEQSDITLTINKPNLSKWINPKIYQYDMRDSGNRRWVELQNESGTDSVTSDTITLSGRTVDESLGLFIVVGDSGDAVTVASTKSKTGNFASKVTNSISQIGNIFMSLFR